MGCTQHSRNLTWRGQAGICQCEANGKITEATAAGRNRTGFMSTGSPFVASISNRLTNRLYPREAPTPAAAATGPLTRYISCCAAQFAALSKPSSDMVRHFVGWRLVASHQITILAYGLGCGRVHREMKTKFFATSRLFLFLRRGVDDSRPVSLLSATSGYFTARSFSPLSRAVVPSGQYRNQIAGRNLRPLIRQFSLRALTSSLYLAATPLRECLDSWESN